jgi:hypothetical protein
MGQYFLAVNPIKRQYVDPMCFGQDNREWDIFDSACGHAVALLMTDSKGYESVQAIPPGNPMRLIGLWLGDPVVVAGDDYGAPNSFGFRTTTDAEPERNLYRMAEDEFQDISYYAVAALCACRYPRLVNLAERARSDTTVLLSLGIVATVFHQQEVPQAMNKFCAQKWRDRFDALRQGGPSKAEPIQPLHEFIRAMKRD